MGESIAEATITKWLKEVGDIVEVDESIVEIATDKVDSDVPSEFKGKLIKKNFEVVKKTSNQASPFREFKTFKKKYRENIKNYD